MAVDREWGKRRSGSDALGERYHVPVSSRLNCETGSRLNCETASPRGQVVGDVKSKESTKSSCALWCGAVCCLLLDDHVPTVPCTSRQGWSLCCTCLVVDGLQALGLTLRIRSRESKGVSSMDSRCGESALEGDKMT
eukprot:750866-Hanusia_phi.AAC.5